MLQYSGTFPTECVYGSERLATDAEVPGSITGPTRFSEE
jgi:hypothetical protein